MPQLNEVYALFSEIRDFLDEGQEVANKGEILISNVKTILDDLNTLNGNILSAIQRSESDSSEAIVTAMKKALPRLKDTSGYYREVHEYDEQGNITKTTQEFVDGFVENLIKFADLIKSKDSQELRQMIGSAVMMAQEISLK